MWTLESVTPTSRGDALALLEAQFAEHSIVVEQDALDAGVLGLVDASRRGAVLLAREGPRAVGVAVLSYTWALEHGGRVAWLEELYVVPDRRGGGIGRALLDHAVAHCREAGCRALDLEVAEDHRRAERLYERAGFRPLRRARWVLPLSLGAP
jgi:GNAT superfamily N-acetyltransferase